MPVSCTSVRCDFLYAEKKGVVLIDFPKQMLDESWLELGLGLSCYRSWSKSEVKDEISDPKRDEGNASTHIGSSMTLSDDSFQNFFKSRSENHDPKGKQKSDPIQYRQENFFTDLSDCSFHVEDCSNEARYKPQFTRYQELWMSCNRTLETEEEKSSSSKRKLLFKDRNCQNKHAKLIDHTENHGENSAEAPSMRNSHVSVTMENDTTGEYEDAAESEAVGQKSWFVLPREERAECSEAFNLNGKYVLSGSSETGSQCQKQPFLSENEPKPIFEKIAFGVPLTLQPLNGLHSVHAIEPSTCVMQRMPNANGEPPLALVNTNCVELAFSYPSVQFPTMEKGSLWAFNSQSPQVSSFTSRKHSAGVQNKEDFEDGAKTSEGSTTHNSIGASSYDGKLPDLKIGMVGETGDCALVDGSKPRNPTRTPTNEAAHKLIEDGFFTGGPCIKLGAAPSLGLGVSSGSFPDLPWVSATGEGPNGRTISGVTCKDDQNGVKVVCACHGIHMSQEEFAQHANGDGLSSS